MSRNFLSCFHQIKNTYCARLYSKSSELNINLKLLLDNAASFQEKNPDTDKWSTPVYITGKPKSYRTQQSLKPNVDPSTTSVILFPGQGTQYVGMAKQLIDYPNVLDMFSCASEILRYNLLDLCLNGPQDMLNMTIHSQVAVVVSSLAALEKLRAENPKMIENCVATAGFSVGEYTALIFTGALDFEKGIKLLKKRGEAMQAASDSEQPSGMMTVFLDTQAKIRLACETAREWCLEQGSQEAECQVAIHLFPHCKVLAGHMEALKFLEVNAASFGIKRIRYLPVSGAFHSKVMLPAKDVVLRALKSTPFSIPAVAVHSNIDGKIYRSVEHIQNNLSDQLTAPVAWEQTMHQIFERDKGEVFPNTFECGPGATLKTILKYNNALACKKCENVTA